MAYMVIWMDTKESKIFTLLTGEVKKEKIQVTAAEEKLIHDRDHHKDPVHFYNEMLGKIKQANEILLVGPGMAKTHFANYLDKTHRDLRKKIVAIENMDHPTDKQIVAMARKFFRAHDLFESLNHI